MKALRVLGGMARTLPDFLIIGAQRSGTTSLYATLCEHPDVRPAAAKEIHFFDHRHHRGALWYRSHFPRRGGRLGARLRGRPWITGEASPSYIFHPLVPERVRQMLPEARLLALLREPVARAFSHYNHSRLKGREDLSFAEAVDRETDRLREDMDMDEGWDGHHHRHHAYLARGRYAEQLERWLRVFPRASLCVLRSEELFTDAPGSLDRIAGHLGLDPAPLRTSGLLARNQRVYGERDQELGARLAAYYEPHNERLRVLLGEDFRWAD